MVLKGAPEVDVWWSFLTWPTNLMDELIELRHIVNMCVTVSSTTSLDKLLFSFFGFYFLISTTIIPGLHNGSLLKQYNLLYYKKDIQFILNTTQLKSPFKKCINCSPLTCIMGDQPAKPSANAQRLASDQSRVSCPKSAEMSASSLSTLLSKTWKMDDWVNV